MVNELPSVLSQIRKVRANSQGTAILGGLLWFEGDYARSYFRATEVLMQSQEVADHFGRFALPVLYLQRHTVEVLMKNLINTFADITELDHQLNATAVVLQRAQVTHDLSICLRLLMRNAQHLGFEAWLPDFSRLVAMVEEIEQGSPDRLRYPTVSVKPPKGKPQKMVDSFPQQVTVGIQDLQDKLRAVFDCIGAEDSGLAANLSLEIQGRQQQIYQAGLLWLHGTDAKGNEVSIQSVQAEVLVEKMEHLGGNLFLTVAGYGRPDQDVARTESDGRGGWRVVTLPD